MLILKKSLWSTRSGTVHVAYYDLTVTVTPDLDSDEPGLSPTVKGSKGAFYKFAVPIPTKSAPLAPDLIRRFPEDSGHPRPQITLQHA
jgi:hypothetical protein